MKDLKGFGHLIRLMMRRERVALPVWIIVVAMLPAATASAFAALYPDPAELEQAANLISGNPAFVAFLGPVYEPSLGGLTVWRVGAFLAVMIGIMNVLTVVRHTRAEEQAGRRELVGSAAVGRHAPLIAALVVVAIADILIGALSTVGLMANGLDTPGSVAFGLGITSVGWLFAGIAAVAAQMFESSRTASGVGIAIVAGSFLLRIVGDAGSGSGLGFFGWVSPIGLVQRIRPFADERFWIVGVLVVVSLALIATAQAISSRRDVGAGVFSSRPGPPVAHPRLADPFALALRLQRGLVLAWMAGFAVFGLLIGAATEGVTDLLADNPTLREIIDQIGGSTVLTDAFLASIFSVFGVVVAAHAVQAVTWLRTEEIAGRVDPILATATPRPSWLGSHLMVGLTAPVLDLVVVGAAAGVGYGATVGDIPGQVPRLIGAALVQLPAVVVIVGLALALFGLVPRVTWIAWAVLSTSVILTLLGNAIGLDPFFIKLSPFSHLPQAPGAETTLGPLLGLSVVAAALIALGFIGFQRRDIT